MTHTRATSLSTTGSTQEHHRINQLEHHRINTGSTQTTGSTQDQHKPILLVHTVDAHPRTRASMWLSTTLSTLALTNWPWHTRTCLSPPPTQLPWLARTFRLSTRLQEYRSSKCEAPGRSRTTVSARRIDRSCVVISTCTMPSGPACRRKHACEGVVWCVCVCMCLWRYVRVC